MHTKQKSQATHICTLTLHEDFLSNNLLLPQSCWPLLIYKTLMTVVVKSQQKISNSIRKNLHLHKSTTNICLYSNSSPCLLPVKGLISIIKSAKIVLNYFFVSHVILSQLQQWFLRIQSTGLLQMLQPTQKEDQSLKRLWGIINLIYLPRSNSPYPRITIRPTQMVANSTIKRSALQHTSLEPVKLLCHKEGLHFDIGQRVGSKEKEKCENIPYIQVKQKSGSSG